MVEAGMIAFIARLKGWVWAAIGLALTVGYALLRINILERQRDNARYERDKARFQVKQRKAVDDNLAEADQEFSHRAKIRNQEKQDDPEKVPDRLRDNNNF